ncbi:unnamed protein product [Urochloa humidicola]
MSLRAVGSLLRTSSRRIVRAGDSWPGLSSKAIWSAAGKGSQPHPSPASTLARAVTAADPAFQVGGGQQLIHRFPTGQGYSNGGAGGVGALVAVATLSTFFGLWVAGKGRASAGASEDTDDDLPESVDWESNASEIPFARTVIRNKQ